LPRSLQGLLIGELDHPDRACPALLNLSMEVVGELYPRPHIYPSRWPDQCLPKARAQPTKQENLHLAPAPLLSTDKPRWHDSAVVEDQDITGAKEVYDFEEMAMFDRPIGSMENHKAGVVPGLDGGLGDKFGGKIIVEVAGLHRLPR